MLEGTVTDRGGSWGPLCSPELCSRGGVWGRELATAGCCCCWELVWVKKGYGGSCCSRDSASMATACKTRSSISQAGRDALHTKKMESGLAGVVKMAPKGLESQEAALRCSWPWQGGLDEV